MISVIIPAKNELKGLTALLPTLQSILPNAEIIVINDGSTDETTQLCKKLNINIITHRYSMGNGAAIKTGARAAQGDTLVFMDADGQHQPQDALRLLHKLNDGYDMIVGARSASGQASFGRLAANKIYNTLASWMVGRKIEDLTSGFRAVKANKFREFIHLLPNGFSYPTTCTIAFFRSGYAIDYLPIRTEKRKGKSHIKIFRDGVRFLLIIFKIVSLYSPLKIFLPLSAIHFILGLSYYSYTYITMARFTNMSALLLSMSIFIFLIGLISEQITMLLYQKRGKE